MEHDALDEDAAPASPDDAATRKGCGAAPGSGHAQARRAIELYLAFLAPCAVIALSVFFIARGAGQRVTMPARSVEAPPQALAVALPPSAAVIASAAPSLENPEVSSSVFYDETDDGEPSAAKRSAPKHFASVQEAAAQSCSTASVEALSRQIIAQARCIKRNALVPLPARPNLVVGAHVFPYLELDARNHLLRALDAHATQKMTINSALRTVAQQYLVWRWSASKRCGVQLATPPGESNHEIGVALDIAEAAQWRSALEGQEFHWLGTSDRVHFDYKGRDASPRRATDVLAFQTLWNRNHSNDEIAADGRYTPATEERLKKAPPSGFAIGPSCRNASTRER